MASSWNLSKGLAAVAMASAAAFGMSPNAAADPAPQPTPQPKSAAPQLPGLPALSELSPIIQQAAGDPQQATQLLMAAAQAFAHNPSAPSESKSVAASVNQFAATPAAPAAAPVPDGAPVPHVPAAGIEPGAQSHLPTGIDPAHAAGPAPLAAPAPAPSAAAPAPAPAPAAAPAAAPAPDAVPAPAPAPSPAPNFGPDAPPTQDFMYPSIGTNCLADGTSAIATALSVAGPAKIPTPGPGPGQTAYVFTAVGTPGPAEVQKLPLNVTWVNLTTGKSGTVALKPRTDINAEGPTTLTAIADTGSGSIMSTIFGQVTTKEKQCQFLPTIGSTVVP
ncbi:Rv1157c family protein [Mycobacterium parmense]|uniref:Uncharacterized protein n=1 Tax=Mycobacterium parmense TaxID=185642 RepID=A0A7I7YLW7_9MYCO|nr:hypothetical protein [Mycobacterium parmense]MCV7349279.1 hypothetical protein [Mycobacterium parmense]ORW57236.1 hypothetical protein AWC20_14055 [Mycobacterium parmense]BBZ42835.1 hypothetical protein MPRM_01160 [Mycobacterium parmense]